MSTRRRAARHGDGSGLTASPDLTAQTSLSGVPALSRMTRLTLLFPPRFRGDGPARHADGPAGPARAVIAPTAFNEVGRYGAQGPRSAGPSGENRSPAAAGRSG